MSQRVYQLAMVARQNGQIAESERLLRSIDISSPEYPDALVALAILAYERRDFQSAAAHFSMLIAIQPGRADHHSNLGECLRECGRLDDAARQLQLGISINRDQPDALNSLGLIFHAQNHLDDAERVIRQALDLRPNFPLALINLGMVLQEKRQLKEATRLFRAALQLEPEHPMALSNLGQILVELGHVDDLDEAEQCCLKAMHLTGNRPHPVNNLGNVYRAMGRFEEAVDCYEQAMRIAPGMGMPLNNMGQALQGRGRNKEAADYYLKAIESDPLSPRFHANYASLFNDEERYDEALERYRIAISIDPNHAESYQGMGQVFLQIQETAKAEAAFLRALEIDPELTAPRMGLANLYSELGEFEKADAESTTALKSYPKLPEAYYQRATHHKGKVTDDDLEKIKALLNEKYLGENAKSQLHFALGTIFDKRKKYNQAGHHFQLANELQYQAKINRNEGYNPENFSSWIDRIIQTITPELMERLKGLGHESQRPIFVIGLPRSGTTLTEQILASHSAVHGAGELDFISKSVERLPEMLKAGHSDAFSSISSLGEKDLQASGLWYLNLISVRNADRSHVVDKMPDNVNLAGWIRLIFPNAKIIHCRRDLRDIALSCYHTCFGSIRWANDWAMIARRFNDYLRVVNHWQNAVGMDWLDFPYEKVTEDIEQYARRLIDFVGLDWEPGCLDFHKTPRQVRTASLSQVREPIYRSSVAKWENYKDQIQPFVNEMRLRGHTFSE